MAADRTALEALRRRAEQSLRGRVPLALTDGLGLGLLFCAAMLLGSDYRAIERWQWLMLLVGLPLLHVGGAALLAGLLQPAYRAHHAALLAGSQLMLLLLEPEAPAGQERVARLLNGAGRQTRGRDHGSRSFERRLSAGLGHWEALCRSCCQQPYPASALLRSLPLVLAGGWAALALALQGPLDLHPLTPPAVFLLAAWLYFGLQRGIARDTFALALFGLLHGSGQLPRPPAQENA